MSFYTALTGLNAATAQMGVTSNNIANVSTTGFKRSRTDFGDIFATSPLQKASATIGQGVALKKVTQEFGQGNLVFSSNTLDLAISGDGFFPLKSQDGFQDIFTRNGVFMMNDQNNVVNSAGQKLMAASVDSSGKANLNDMNVLTIPQKTTGMAKQTSKVQLGLNFPADAAVINKTFNRNDPETYNKSTALTVYDAGGNSYLASVYYVKTQDASQATPNNKWQTYVYVGDKLVNASLQQATNSLGEDMYVNKYGQLKAKSDFKTPQDIAELNSSFSKTTVKFSLDNLTDIRTSQPAAVTGGSAVGLGTASNDGVDFSTYVDMSKTELLKLQGSSNTVFALQGSGVAATDAVNVSFEVAGVAQKIDIPSSTTAAPSAVDFAKALNNDANFASTYVAQAGSNAIFSGVSFSDTPSASDFKSLDLVVGSQSFTVSNFKSADANSLAAEIQASLRKLDGGNSDIKVTAKYVAGTSGPFTLDVTDFAGREIKSVSLNPKDTTVLTPVTPVITNGLLSITALDPNVTGDAIQKNFTINQGSFSTANVSGSANYIGSVVKESSYIRTEIGYALGTTPAIFKATVGSGGSQKIIQSEAAESASAFADRLNISADFSASYTATAVDGGIQVTAKDPSAFGLDAVKGNLTIYADGVTSAPTFINDPTSADVLPAVAAKATSATDMKKKSIDELKDLFTINVDGSMKSIDVGLSGLVKSMQDLPSTASKVLSGTQLAAELTNVIRRAYGDEKPFDFSSVPNPTMYVNLTPAGKSEVGRVPINLAGEGKLRPEDLVRVVQDQIDAQDGYQQQVKVSYDPVLQKLVFTPTETGAKMTISSEQSAMNLSDPLVQGVNDSSVGLPMSPSVATSPFVQLNDQRYGMKVEYDSVKQTFVFKSGSTGDNSSLVIDKIRPGSLATQSAKGLGMTGDPASYVIAPSTVDALRGTASLPAVLTGNALAVNVDNNFSVDATNNQFVVSVNGITGTVLIPPKDTYTMGTFMEALQNGINNLQGPSKNGLTPESVNGVKVSYNASKNALEFTTGTASTDSYVKITGDARWGLDGLDAKFGTTTTWVKPTPFKDDKGATVYIDGFGKETSSATGFDSLPAWSPVYFDKGELTFDTAGNLVSPKQGAQLDTVYLPNGKGALTINIDYSKSTQFASPFSVLSQSQDGAPEGDLVGLAIKDDGLVQASYSNGSQKSLAKVVLVNFSNPSGLRQIGDTNYYKTSDSGTPKYGEAGSAGYGTVRSGATERANVDLTQELVDLITEQRNFQANAKAMETSTSMTNTIIQIRN
jgi:flagellar hook-basal body protein